MMDTSKLRQLKSAYHIVGDCDALNLALDRAVQVARTDLSVLIVGESGVGKEVIPRIIHDHSPRKHGKYFAINCGSIPEGTIDSELFGHEKGSYTGAIGESEGYFGTANGGTIFLDEVGELPLATQARLLRVLENGEYIRVGGQTVLKTDVRIVAATNVNMHKAITEGRFRSDLYYRLNGVPIEMPPLRERGNDIIRLFQLFALQMVERYHIPHITLSEEAKQVLLHYKWPGNVRELKNITEQIAIMSDERVLSAATIRQYIPEDRQSTELVPLNSNHGPHSYESEREMLLKVLYELRTNVGDLRRELNGLRKHIDDSAQLHLAASNRSALYPTHQDTPASSSDADKLLADMPGVEDAEAEELDEPESLNLSNLGRQMIEKALERNGGNRKKAASELGISDRTLYRRLKQYGMTLLLLLMMIVPQSCVPAYKFNGASIDYTKTKTIQISDFPIRATYVWSPMMSIFNNELKDRFAAQTRLEQVRKNGDLSIDGEITQYNQRNKSVSSEGYSEQTELSMTVHVRFTNNVNHQEDFERDFTATSSYSTTVSLNSVQEGLVTDMVKEIVDQIFNATVANW